MMGRGSSAIKKIKRTIAPPPQGIRSKGATLIENEEEGFPIRSARYGIKLQGRRKEKCKELRLT